MLNWPGQPYPLGATFNGSGTNFALFSEVAERVELCLFDDDGNEVFKGTWMRLLRRLVRDSNFRGTPAAATLDMWANVRRGEKRFISPFKERANLMFDSSFPCEVSILKNYAAPLLAAVPEGAERYAEIRSILPALERFETIDPTLLAPESMLREFIGGGIYEY